MKDIIQNTRDKALERLSTRPAYLECVDAEQVDYGIAKESEVTGKPPIHFNIIAHQRQDDVSHSRGTKVISVKVGKKKIRRKKTPRKHARKNSKCGTASEDLVSDDSGVISGRESWSDEGRKTSGMMSQTGLGPLHNIPPPQPSLSPCLPDVTHKKKSSCEHPFRRQNFEFQNLSLTNGQTGGSMVTGKSRTHKKTGRVSVEKSDDTGFHLPPISVTQSVSGGNHKF